MNYKRKRDAKEREEVLPVSETLSVETDKKQEKEEIKNVNNVARPPKSNGRVRRKSA